MNSSQQHIHTILKNIPIFWINLERSESRRNNMQDILDKCLLQHTRIEAIDGNNICLEEYKEKYNINEKMNKYEVACALSHMKTIKYCYDEGLEYALVLEDDATFEYFPYKTHTILELLDQLKAQQGETLQLANIINKKVFLTLRFKTPLLQINNIAGAQSYLITRKGMEKVLHYFETTKNIHVSEFMIFNITKNYITPPYFSYPFLRNENGEKVNVSTIRENTKSAHATQTISKLLWNDYYSKKEE